LGGALTGNTQVDGSGFTYNFSFGKLNEFITLSHASIVAFDTLFSVKNFIFDLDIIRSDNTFRSIAFIGAAQDSTPMKWQGGRSDGSQDVLNESHFVQSGLDFIYSWPDRAGTTVMEDFAPSNVSNAYIIELPEASTCEGREINFYYNNIHQANVTVFDGAYTSGVLVQDYLSRGIDFSLGNDNFWVIKSVQASVGVYKWLVFSNMRVF
jgi:hypothetical protein